MKTVVFALGATLALTTAAAAQQVCMTAAEMQSSLIDWYGERPTQGPSNDNTRLWVSDANGSWTLVRTLSDGNACVVGTGMDWVAGMDATEKVATIQARIEG
ncbi:S-adenosyl-L-homocysteine hydrolase [Sulfitobacter sp. S190]|uniref:S-adenosyl-L-homocysteine hydrolase n=1 Tax=Sulfitobacter sp. S190 TaxID=2867022 RepID=UPI0021A68740|nr:S-adenosyl-L-homocysteine hydrolase [Sulfitobacter sp. S190]UWR22444.1 S-adenosyl-L-homocysteine hydrolase [Sulfitobacter sp. S190]